ncbi:MAG: folate-binding protein, partial [Celeribacter marinus]
MTERSIIALSGSDTHKFLQGLITNDIGGLERGAVYAAILTPQGKFMVDFFLVREGDTVLLDVATPDAAALLKRLTMYKLRSDVTLILTERTVSRGLGAVPDGAVADPRHGALGWRAYDG